MDYSVTLNGRCLEYYEDEHIYLVDGVIVPSVSQVLDAKLRKYDGIDKGVLQRAAERGTRVHQAIERYCRTGWEEPMDEVKNFQFLQNYFKFDVMENELPVIIDIDGKVIAGRLDMLIKRGLETGVVDIKSTSSLDKERTGCQLNLYRIGVEQCYGICVDFLAALHLKGDTRKYVGLPLNEEYVEKMVKEYFE